MNCNSRPVRKVALCTLWAVAAAMVMFHGVLHFQHMGGTRPSLGSANRAGSAGAKPALEALKAEGARPVERTEAPASMQGFSILACTAGAFIACAGILGASAPASAIETAPDTETVEAGKRALAASLFPQSMREPVGLPVEVGVGVVVVGVLAGAFGRGQAIDRDWKSGGEKLIDAARKAAE